MDKTIIELKGFLCRLANRKQEIGIEIRELQKEYEALNSAEHELNKILDVAEREKEESEDDMK